MNPAPDLTSWQRALQVDDPAAVLQALRAWPQQPTAVHPQAAVVWRVVEDLALRGPTPQIQAAAREALTSPAAQRFYAVHTIWPPVPQRARLRAEIQRWAQEGLITPAQAAVLQARYAAPPPRATTATPAPSRRSARSWALHVVLYLGAFFVIAAALLFSAAVEAWRLPILAVVTLLFTGAAAGVYLLTPTGGRVLGIVAGGLLWATLAALAERLSLHWDSTALRGYWAAATFFLGLAWLAGGWLLRSVVLSIAAWPMFAASAALFLDWSTSFTLTAVRLSWLFLAWSGELWLAVLWARLLRRRHAKAGTWLWTLAHGVALLLILGTGPISAMDSAFEENPAWLWLPAAAAYGLLAGFYPLARGLMRPLRWLDTWAPLLAGTGLTLTWGLAWETPHAGGLAWLTLAGVWAGLAYGLTLARARVRAWPHAAEFLAGLAVLLAGLPWLNHGYPALAIAVWGLAALVAGVVAWRFTRWAAAGWAWLLAFLALNTTWGHYAPPSWQPHAALWLLGCTGLSALWDALGHWRARRAPALTGRVGTALLTLLTWLVALANIPHRGSDALALIGLLALLLAYARAVGLPWLVGLGPWLAWSAWFTALDAAWASPHAAALAVAPVLAGLAGLLGERLRPGRGSRAWTWGALTSGWFNALLLLGKGDGWSALMLAALASLTAASAWRWRQVWLALPAAGLYFGAYALTLRLWQVEQPQVYTVPAALLGLLLHELYRRTGHRVVAFLMGLLAQLVLFTTTYFQMVDARSGWYFAMLFLQALVVLGYGLGVNAGGLIWPPVGFVVLATVTMVLIRFQGLGVLLLLGCTGMLLLLGGLFWLIRRGGNRPPRPTPKPNDAPQSGRPPA